MKLSVVIPVHNEESGVAACVGSLIAELSAAAIPFELVIVDDNSTDATARVLGELARGDSRIRVIRRSPPRGFGRAVREGLSAVTGDAVVIFMGDLSDNPKDVVAYYEKLREGYDCVFGSRFMRGSRVRGYPAVKFVLNRCGNLFIQLLFLIGYNDVSNAFKAYRSGVISGIQPLISQYFNITVEIPLKAIVRGYRYAVIPISWDGRQSGVSKYRIRDLSRKYFFSILYVWLERILLQDEVRTQEASGK